MISQLFAEEAGLEPALAYHHQVLQYKTGERYNPHQDCGQPGERGKREERGGTALVYLTDVKEGGATCFTQRKLCVRPRKGAALFFQSLTDDLACDLRSQHYAALVHRGTKVVLQRWYYTNFMAPMEYDFEEVMCDGGRNCRHYLFNRRRVAAARLVTEGQRLAGRGQVEQAEAAYRDAYELYPTLSYAAAMHGQAVYEKQRDLERSKRILSDALHEAPMFPAVHYYLGRIYLEQQQLALGKRHLEIVLAVPNPDPPALVAMT